MSLIRIITAIVLSLCLTVSVAAGPSEDAVAAFSSGDYATAIRIWHSLADRGSATAQTFLGMVYADGRGVTQNYAEAAKWYRLASDQGHSVAQFNLGYMYAHGQGVPQDYVTAHMLFNLASAKGEKGATDNRDLIARQMTPAQIAEAQKLARDWKPK